VVYYVLCKVWPTKNQKLIKEMGLRWEEQKGDTVVAADGTRFVEEGKIIRVLGETSDGTELVQEAYVVDKRY
jgi:NCS1 family nucleobase:cation symporter-1